MFTGRGTSVGFSADFTRGCHSRTRGLTDSPPKQIGGHDVHPGSERRTSLVDDAEQAATSDLHQHFGRLPLTTTNTSLDYGDCVANLHLDDDRE